MRKWVLSGLVIIAYFCLPRAATAAEFVYVTPRVVIYPGGVVEKEDLIEVRQTSSVTGSEVFPGVEELAGKIAIVTLRPNMAIRSRMVRAPAIFRMGALVTLRFEHNGISILSTGLALQNGFVGQRVRVRNQESGIIINGFVKRDGSIEVD